MRRGGKGESPPEPHLVTPPRPALGSSAKDGRDLLTIIAGEAGLRCRNCSGLRDYASLNHVSMNPLRGVKSKHCFKLS